MIQVEIGHWAMGEIFKENIDIYNWLHDQPQETFEYRSKKAEWYFDDNGKFAHNNNNFEGLTFYVNDFSNIPQELWKHCTFKPVPMLEMMGGGRINSVNVLEAAKLNQIMLPNNLMLDMKELRIELNQCTDAINDLLRDGWKLIAVLPQHQQARPDYLLGRTKVGE